MSGAYPMPQGDPAALYHLADQLDGAGGTVAGLADHTATVTAGIRDQAEWTGSAADAYSEFTAGLYTGVGKVEEPLTGIASAVRGFAGALEAAQRQVGTANSWLQTAGPAGAQQIGQLDQQVSRVMGELDTAAKSAGSQITAAAGRLGDAFGADGAVRAWLERVHAPWDALGADAPLAVLTKNAETAEKFASKFGKTVEELNNPKAFQQMFDDTVQTVAHNFDHGEATWSDMEAAYSRYAGKVSDIEELAGDVGDAESTARALPWLKGIGVGADGLAIVGDAYTLAKPEDGGAMGWVDRGAAATNMGLAGADGAIELGLLGAEASMPVVGTVALVGTGLFLGGDYLYHHWTPFHNFCNDVGHTTVSVAKDIGGGIVSGAKDIGGGIVSGAKDIGGGIVSGAKDIGSFLGL